MKWYITALGILFFYKGNAQSTLNKPIFSIGLVENFGSLTSLDYTVSTLAGSGTAGNINNKGADALLNCPKAVAVDTRGNILVADAANNIIRKITADGLVSNYAGTGLPGSSDGPVAQASFYFPSGIAIDKDNNVYIADKGNHRIRKILANGTVTTLAGSIRGDAEGIGAKARFNKPVSVAVDKLGFVFVADQFNQKIRKISPSGEVKTIAGNGQLGNKDGVGAEASFYDPAGVATDHLGNVYVADYSNNRIRKINANGTVTTLSGSNAVGSEDGVAQTATFYFPDAVAVDAVGNVYICDQVNNKIRMLAINGKVYTIAGSGSNGSTDGQGKAASFNNPAGVAVDHSGYLYIADYNNHKIRKIIPVSEPDLTTEKM